MKVRPVLVTGPDARHASRISLLRTWCSTAARDPPEVVERVQLPSSASFRSSTGRGPGPRTPPKRASGVQLLGGLSRSISLASNHSLPPWGSLEFPPACHAGDRGCKSRWGRRASLGELAEPPARGAGVSGCKSRGKHRGVEQQVARQAHNLEVAGANPVSAISALWSSSRTSVSETEGRGATPWLAIDDRPRIPSLGSKATG